MALTRNKAFIYATVNAGSPSLWYLNMETAQWINKQLCDQIEIDDDSKLYCLLNKVITDLKGETYSAAACTDFVVDDMYFFCLRSNKKLYRRHKSNVAYQKEAEGLLFIIFY